MPKLTDRSVLAVPADPDLIHIVDVSDTTDSPLGSSKQATLTSVFGNVGIVNVVIIQSESDFPAPVSGVIPLEATEYRIVGSVTITTPLAPPKDGIVTIRGVNSIQGTLVYTGSESLFKNIDFGIGVLFIIEVTVGCTAGQIFDIDGAGDGAVLCQQMAFISVESLGTAKNVLFSILIANVFDFGQGIICENNNGLVFSEISWDLGRNEVGATFITIRGAQANIEITSDFLNTSGANETILSIESDVTTTGAIVSAVSLDVSDGGTIFETGSLSQSALGWRYSGNIGVADSTVKGILQFSGNTLVTDMAGGVEEPINTIWSNGTLEERICFRDKVTFDSATDTLTSVDGDIELSGGIAFSHGMSNGDSVTLVENGGLPTGLAENTTYFVGSVTATTFQLFSDPLLVFLVTFTTDGTEPNYYNHSQGNSTSGWFVYIGLDPVAIAVNGWLTIEKASGSDSSVRSILMATDNVFNVSVNSAGSTVSAKNNVPSSSQLTDIINVTTGDGFLIYLENLSGTVDNEVTDARITTFLA